MGWRQGGRVRHARSLPVAEAVRLAVGLHRQGQLDAAQELYERLLKRSPEHADANHFYGVLLSQRGRHAQAWEYISRSLRAKRFPADWHSNAGNVLLSLSRLEEAADAYERCVRAAPGHAEAYNNLGVLRRMQGRREDAQACFRRALELRPDHVGAWINLASLLFAWGQNEASRECCDRALALRPKEARHRRMLGHLCYTLGDRDKAAAVYREWLAEDPDNAQARHHLAACTGDDVPARAADDYVESVFDSFAGSFDVRLAELHYRAPELVAGVVGRIVGPAAKALAVLDAGCGTGLCGPLLAPYARTLDGVDLSAGMLEKAAPRQVYDALHKAELTAFMQQAPGRYDLVVSADTLCYFGDLQAAFQAAHQALTPGGWLVFTVEAWLDEAVVQGFQLQPHGRYKHAASYVRRLLAETGFEVGQLEQAVLRTENLEPVQGWVVAARRPAGGAPTG